jgi:hypothetical protein
LRNARTYETVVLLDEVESPPQLKGALIQAVAGESSRLPRPAKYIGLGESPRLGPGQSRFAP